MTIKIQAFYEEKWIDIDGLDFLRDGEPIVLLSKDRQGGLPQENIGKLPLRFTIDNL